MSVPAPAPAPASAPPDSRSSRPAPDVWSAPRRPHAARAAARRGNRSAFWLFAAGVVALMVMSLVAVNAMLVNTTYRMQAVQREVKNLSSGREDLRNDVARLSSPFRVAEWAAARGMVMPDPGDSVILTVPGTRGDGGG